MINVFVDSYHGSKIREIEEPERQPLSWKRAAAILRRSNQYPVAVVTSEGGFRSFLRHQDLPWAGCSYKSLVESAKELGFVHVSRLYEVRGHYFSRIEWWRDVPPISLLELEALDDYLQTRIRRIIE